MKYNLAFVAAFAAVSASPLAYPQGVTAQISPSAPAPSGCMDSYSGSFGVVVQNMTMGGAAGVTTMPDGQPNAKTSAAPATQISDGQPQASTGAPVSQISDGQPQASTGMKSMPAVTQISDGQIQGPTMTPMNQISDGQVQQTKPAPVPAPAATQISDGQPQAPKGTAPAATQISDGQPQAPKSTAPAASQISDGQPQAPKTSAPAASQISDGQPQAPKTTAPAASQISDGQPQAPTSAASQISDGQPQAPTGTGASQMSDGQPSSPSATGMAAPQMVACSGEGVLTLTLEGGVLMDNKGRTGYIAANYQFQFDKPPQAGAIYTSGWSVCGNGSLALGGSTIFYQCLSGDFYNLYNEDWAAQCNAVTIDTLMLKDCSK